MINEENLSMSDMIEGVTWYPIARQEIFRLSTKYRVGYHRVAAVISALSPASYWHRNLADAENVIREYKFGFRQYRVATYYNNKVKALKILESKESPLSFFKTSKTRCFYLNLIGRRDVVTIDRHMVAMFGQDTKVFSNKKLYASLQKRVVKIASELRMNPSDAQAVLWVNWKRLKKGE